MKIKYYSLDKILSKNATYNVIIGERSNGKTYAVLKFALQRYFKDSSQLAIIRRWEEDYKGKNGRQMFENLVVNGEVTKLSKGRWNSIRYQSQSWWLCNYDENGKVIDQSEKPVAFGFALSSEEHYKSSSYPNVRTVLFDEFLTRSYTLPDEFVKFTSILSTIIRLRDDVTIFMCGNTVNKDSLYFKEMGLTNVKNMRRGSIDVYTYGESDLTVAVEYSDFNNPSDKKSNKYFAFDNPKLRMITKGEWEINIYPHLPCKYDKQNIIYTYYVCYSGDILQCEIINVDNLLFTYVHRKTTPIKDDETSMIFQEEYDPRPNYRRRLTKPTTTIEKRIASFFLKDKVFYQSNDIGEIMRNYLMWSSKQQL